jgi:septum formation protein
MVGAWSMVKVAGCRAGGGAIRMREPMPELQRPDAPEVVLASASATRASLLRAAGVRVVVRPAAVDEDEVKAALRAAGAPVEEAAVTFAALKAQRSAGAVAPAAVVVGADQILTCEGRWHDKPRDRGEARAQLQALAGRRHELTTAVVAFRAGERVWHEVARARLWMRPCSDAFLDRYLDAVGAAALSSVGSYQIEGLGAQLFTRIEGDRFAIEGLPLLPVLEFLRVQGVLEA